MSNSSKASFLIGLILPLLMGILITTVSGLYARTTTGQYCSPDPAINATIDCSLQVNNRGLPLAYDINPNYQLKHGIQSLALIGDIGIWSALSSATILIIRKTRL
jgi:hypothetical protein